MRPLDEIFIVVIILGITAVGAWTQDKRRSTKISAWAGTWLIFLSVYGFFPDDIGPASWADVADWITPDGYAEHSVETSISAQQSWFVGETKECVSSPLRYKEARQLGKELGFVAGSINCDDGPKHTVRVNLYGRLNQPEQTRVNWRCTREPEAFTCRQTGAQ